MCTHFDRAPVEIFFDLPLDNSILHCCALSVERAPIALYQSSFVLDACF